MSTCDRKRQRQTAEVRCQQLWTRRVAAALLADFSPVPLVAALSSDAIQDTDKTTQCLNHPIYMQVCFALHNELAKTVLTRKLDPVRVSQFIRHHCDSRTLIVGGRRRGHDVIGDET